MTSQGLKGTQVLAFVRSKSEMQSSPTQRLGWEIFDVVELGDNAAISRAQVWQVWEGRFRGGMRFRVDEVLR
jgi:hypothetical protein